MENNNNNFEKNKHTSKQIKATQNATNQSRATQNLQKTSNQTINASKKSDFLSNNSNQQQTKLKNQNEQAINSNVGKVQDNLKAELKTEKQKQAEVASGGKQAKSKFSTSSLSRNIIIVFVVLLMSFVSVASVAIAGNFPKTVVIAANEINTRIAQAKLAELGYFEGVIDGIFDDETISAIKNYQKENNLTQTGNLDQVTAAAIGVTDNTQANTDLYLLAKLIHSEARGEPYEGQVAVGAVVLNRVDDAGFPNTLQGVIYQPWAFTALHDGQFNLEPTSTSYQAAQDALNGWDPSYGCLYYYNPATATSSWIFSRQTIVVIGNHVFCI